jgi:hypothetical protein
VHRHATVQAFLSLTLLYETRSFERKESTDDGGGQAHAVPITHPEHPPGMCHRPYAVLWLPALLQLVDFCTSVMFVHAFRLGLSLHFIFAFQKKKYRGYGPKLFVRWVGRFEFPCFLQ